MASEKIQTIVISVIISKIAICVSVQIILRIVNISMVHSHLKTVLTVSILRNVNTATSASVVRIVSEHKNVSIVGIHVTYYFALTAADAIIVLAAQISETNHIIFSMNLSQKKYIKKE